MANDKPAYRCRHGRTTATAHMRRGVDVRHQATAEDVIGYLLENEITLTYDQATASLRAGTGRTAKTIITKAS